MVHNESIVYDRIQMIHGEWMIYLPWIFEAKLVYSGTITSLPGTSGQTCRQGGGVGFMQRKPWGELQSWISSVPIFFLNSLFPIFSLSHEPTLPEMARKLQLETPGGCYWPHSKKCCGGQVGSQECLWMIQNLHVKTLIARKSCARSISLQSHHK